MKKQICSIMEKEVRPALYSVGVVLAVVFIGVCFATINYIANDFGLWRHRDQVRIWELEKTSKYLLAHRYVPENFDGVMVGSSLSANMDTRRLKDLRIYNLSMSGGNITEVSAAATAYLNNAKNPRVMIVTLHPYMTRNHGMKSFQIDPKEYYGSVFSLLPVTLWIRKLQFMTGMMHGAYDDSVAGWNHFNIRDKGGNLDLVEESARKTLAILKHGKEDKTRQFITIDPTALQELDDLLKLARAKGAKIIAYYYPYFGPEFEIPAYTGEWKTYRSAMDRLFQPGEIVMDMNTAPYDSLRYDHSAYFDRSHMSQSGADRVLDQLNLALRARIGHDPAIH